MNDHFGMLALLDCSLQTNIELLDCSLQTNIESYQTKLNYCLGSKSVVVFCDQACTLAVGGWTLSINLIPASERLQQNGSIQVKA